jgi:hypothetical protein
LCATADTGRGFALFNALVGLAAQKWQSSQSSCVLFHAVDCSVPVLRSWQELVRQVPVTLPRFAAAL